MALSFAGSLDPHLLLDAVAAITPLVRAPQVAARWDEESALPGMTVGGLTRHLVSQPECAVEFLPLPIPAGAPHPSLLAYADSWDWLDAGRDDAENTSIRDEFNAMSESGPAGSVAILDHASAALPPVLDAAGPLTFVPWQGCALATADFLACRLLEIVVHADDLAVSVDVATPDFPDDVVDPVVRLLAALALRRHEQTDVIRALSRAERSSGSISAFSSPTAAT